ncbi:MAG: hypothetical protein AMJ54_10635 [Deltaproteobacteria bacterium SG8_13]|nr:MAG: hypothetical protein AMJ54_10635 [Deltaproteobacteria bacterium SG8_13]
MCLILFAYDIHPQYRLLLAANRDEFYERPTLPLDVWEDRPDIFAGRDLKGGGTWLGISRSGRIAAVTNYRDPRRVLPQAPSRGFLVGDYLAGSEPAERYLSRIASEAHRYNGFNLIVGDRGGLWYLSNQSAEILHIEPGVYGLSNHLLNTSWPKVRNGKAGLQKLIEEGQAGRIEPMLALLADKTPAADNALPDTGVGLQWERVLSPIFITSATYGTRSSSVIQVSRNGKVTFVERSFTCQSGETCRSEDRRFSFSLTSGPCENGRN